MKQLDDSALAAACDRFVVWLDRAGCASHDPYDIWGTRYGLWSRKIYYKHRGIGMPLVAPLLAMEMFCPWMRRLVVEKQRYATADAQLVLAFLNLHALEGARRHLDRALDLGRDLLAEAIPGFSGPCWGYPFDWENGHGSPWPKNTPYITCTPYAYEAFVGLFETTGDPAHLQIARGIARFVHDDLKDIPTGGNSAAASYSPFDDRRVVNASAYRAFVLFDAARRFDREDYRATATRNLNFVLDSQRDDGAWFYAMEDSPSFIDNFHTCFNLKNLHKLNRALRSPRVGEAIRRGFDFYLRNLIDSSGNPRSFAVEPRFQLATLEMYNVAEAITLGTLLRKDIPEAGVLAERLVARLVSRHQLPDGHFVTRVYRGGIRHRFPFLRWPQAQLFLALTNFRVARAEAVWRRSGSARSWCGDPPVLEHSA